jgi:hypothetical protein
MFNNQYRLLREKQTVGIMIDLYCKMNHSAESNCNECREIKAYVFKKLEKCPFGIQKPTCLNCKVHCYQKSEREKIREIMKFSGPKMIFRHPYLAIMHILDNRILAKNFK